MWNEANGSYWEAPRDDFYKLHDYAVDGVRRALPTARVGGPDSAGAGGEFMDGFLRHVTSGTNYATGKVGTPTDFLAFHAKGRPTFVDGQNGNSFAAWTRMASPLNPDATQYAALEKASAMQPQPIALSAGNRGTMAASFDLPRQGVALVILDRR